MTFDRAHASSLQEGSVTAGLVSRFSRAHMLEDRGIRQKLMPKVHSYAISRQKNGKTFVNTRLSKPAAILRHLGNA